jgi:hypothetical protein
MKTRIAIASIAITGVAAVGFGGIYAAAASGNDKDAAEHVVMVTTDPTGAQEQFYALGPITGVPAGTQLSETRDQWTFADGTVVVEHTVKHENDQFDPKSCSATLDETGTWRVVSGTGTYAHAQGHGTYTFRGHGSSDPGTCGPNTLPTTFLGVVVASGEMSV